MKKADKLEDALNKLSIDHAMYNDMMVTFDYEKNTIDDTIGFLFYMLQSYSNLRKNILLCEHDIKKAKKK